MTASGLSGRARGQPLLVLGGILGGWLVMRALLWQPLFGPTGLAPMLARHPIPSPASLPASLASLANRPNSSGPQVPGRAEAPNGVPVRSPWLTSGPAGPLAASPPVAEETPPAGRIVGQELLLAAAFAQMELPLELAAYLAGSRGRTEPLATSPGGQPLLGRQRASSASDTAPWSGDAWLFLREDSSGPLAAGKPSYGRSQAGAVLRYRLAPSSGHRPFAYARVTRALAGAPETEVAAGLAARPLTGVPVSLAGEARVTQGPAGRELRPAAFVVTELAPADLPLGWRAEAYAQAGYVGGRNATAFVDGLVRADTRIAALGRGAEIRAGGGVWGGAQKHAARLDAGPSASVSFRLGEVPSHVAVDYRLRLAGDAQPASGPSVTFSAGF